ncbi:hypothetical protein ACL7TT_14335 [Microbulbifer sp. 2304DJ12-6]|uniref:hypothetical protein n=1 Tax=Microbulbifer sp. 2304DJ12-6 TaxID=3233340 RepID=UPI0039AE97BB
MLLPTSIGKPVLSPPQWLHPDTFTSAKQRAQDTIKALQTQLHKAAIRTPALAESSNSLQREEPNTTTTEVFTWRDREGNWHFSDTVPEGLRTPALAESSNSLQREEPNTTTTEVFTWRDREGNWHFSDTVPEGLGRSVRIHRIKPINTVPVAEISPSAAQRPQEHFPPGDSVSDLLKEIRALQKKRQQHQQALDNL